VRQVDCTCADGVRLRRHARGFGPLARATSDHYDEARGERDRQRGGRSSARGISVGGDPVEQLAKLQFEVVVGCQTVESTAVAERFLDLRLVPLYLSESDVDDLVEPGAAVDAIEACFRRMAVGEVEIAPRRRLRLPEGALADMAAADSGLRLAGGKLYAATANGRDVRRVPLRLGEFRARRLDRSRPPRTAPNRRGECGRRAPSREGRRARSA
jgi:hypothetical protein